MLHGLLLSVIIFLNQVVLRAAIKAFMLSIFKPQLQYSWHKTVFWILLLTVQIKLMVSLYLGCCTGASSSSRMSSMNDSTDTAGHVHHVLAVGLVPKYRCLVGPPLMYHYVVC